MSPMLVILTAVGISLLLNLLIIAKVAASLGTSIESLAKSTTWLLGTVLRLEGSEEPLFQVEHTPASMPQYEHPPANVPIFRPPAIPVEHVVIPQSLKDRTKPVRDEL